MQANAQKRLAGKTVELLPAIVANVVENILSFLSKIHLILAIITHKKYMLIQEITFTYLKQLDRED